MFLRYHMVSIYRYQVASLLVPCHEYSASNSKDFEIQSKPLHEILGSHDGKDVGDSLLGCKTVQTCS
jgi:hypothetical protein